MTPDSLRIALCTHSTHPRGGVVHAIELAEALTEMGHRPVVIAPDSSGRGFYRALTCAHALFPAAEVTGGLPELVEQRVMEYFAFLSPRAGAFDVFHAQDSMSANAMADLAARGAIGGFVRTVHHLDDVTNPALVCRQDRSVSSAAACFCVSRLWQEKLRSAYRIDAELVPNGVNLRRFSPRHDDSDQCLKKRLGLGRGPIFLSVGGIEHRKNSIAILQSFRNILPDYPDAQLLIAGGASILDHTAYRREFEALLQDSALASKGSVVFVNVVADEEMPALFRAADALVFPSLREGFGLVVLEAMACGTPAIVSDEPPFTEYVTPREAILVDPRSVQSITDAMRRAIGPDERIRLTHAGLSLCEALTWEHSAAVHIDLYLAMLERLARSHALNTFSSALA